MSRTHAPHPHAATRPRRGTTLVEILIASVLMTVAVLGLLSTSKSVSDQMGAGRRQMVAASMAQRRLDSLQSLPCATLSAAGSGRSVMSGIEERWTVSGSGATRLVELQLRLPRLRTPYTYTTLVAC